MATRVKACGRLSSRISLTICCCATRRSPFQPRSCDHCCTTSAMKTPIVTIRISHRISRHPCGGRASWGNLNGLSTALENRPDGGHAQAARSKLGSERQLSTHSCH